MVNATPSGPALSAATVVGSTCAKTRLTTSTICVYTYFGGRGSLLAAAHKEAGQELLDAVAGHEPGAARVHAAADWMNAHPRLALDGQAGTMRLSEMVGLLVLDGRVSVDEDVAR